GRPHRGCHRWTGGRRAPLSCDTAVLYLSHKSCGRKCVAFGHMPTVTQTSIGAPGTPNQPAAGGTFLRLAATLVNQVTTGVDPDLARSDGGDRRPINTTAVIPARNEAR